MWSTLCILMCLNFQHTYLVYSLVIMVIRGNNFALLCYGYVFEKCGSKKPKPKTDPIRPQVTSYNAMKGYEMEMLLSSVSVILMVDIRNDTTMMVMWGHYDNLHMAFSSKDFIGYKWFRAHFAYLTSSYEMPAKIGVHLLMSSEFRYYTKQCTSSCLRI